MLHHSHQLNIVHLQLFIVSRGVERPDNHCVLLYAKQERGEGHLAAQNTDIERISQTDALVQQASAVPADSEEGRCLGGTS